MVKEVWVVCLAVLTVATTARATQDRGAEFRKIGEWSVYRTIDAETGDVTCVGVYAGNERVRLTSADLAIGIWGRGGVETYHVSFDDERASVDQMPDDFERRFETVWLTGPTFERLKTAKRVRFEGFAAPGEAIVEDIDLTDFQEAFAVISSAECAA